MIGLALPLSSSPRVMAAKGPWVYTPKAFCLYLD